MLARIPALVTALLLPLLVLVVAGSPPAAAATAHPPQKAAWLVASDGGIFSAGGAPFYGSMGGHPLNKPIVGIGAPLTGRGYWEVASDGGIFTFGNLLFYGSMGGHPLNKPVVGMAAMPTGGGYWEVASDGGIFTFGNAQFYGSMGGHPLNQPVVGMAAMPTGGGYWEVARDGGIFTFGNAQFYGSMGGHPLNQPIVGMAAMPTGGGYWEVARDGGIFTFGKASFHGSEGGVPQSRPIVGIAAPSTGGGYWMTNNNGLVYSFGSAAAVNSAPQVLNAPIVGIAAAVSNGDPGSPAFQSGSYGYDISDWQCTGFPPSPHQVGVVQVEGSSMGKTNPCLAAEATWAGAGLNLYIYLTYRTTASSADSACNGTVSCNGGWNTGIDAFQKAESASINVLVPWWLDVEAPGVSWSGTGSHNQQFINGVIAALHYEGINSVGIYASPGVWPQIVGTWRPPVPYWAADWADRTPATLCRTFHVTWTDTPSGPLVLIQYSSPGRLPTGFTPRYESGGMDTTFDNDYAC